MMSRSSVVVLKNGNTFNPETGELWIRNGTTEVDLFEYQLKTNIKIVYLSNSVETIKDGAFDNCHDLRVIYFSKNGNLKEIWPRAFSNCTKLTAVHLPDSVTSVGDGAFAMCSGITTVQLPNTLTKIGKSAFSGCTKITSVILPNSLTKIGDCAFDSCFKITTLHLPDTLAEIGESAFENCSKITTLHLPDTMACIGKYAFSNCSKITTLHLPNSLTVIGESAFSNCLQLVAVLAPDALVKNEIVDTTKVFNNCPSLNGSGLTPYSAIKPSRRFHWHETMHHWCSQAAKEAVIAFLICERWVDERVKQDQSALVSLDHELWLKILTFIRRDKLGSV